MRLRELPLAQAVDGLSREDAAEVARDELARQPYQDAQPSLVARLLARVFTELAELLGRASANAPGGVPGLLLLLLLLGAVAWVVLRYVRPRRAGRARPLFDSARALTADGHRAAAEQAAAQGRWADAVRERLRAVVRELEQRGVLDPRPGRTADEVAAEAGAAVPATAADLHRAVRVFDEVWYGGRPATAQSYAVLVEVDRRVAEQRLAVTR